MTIGRIPSVEGGIQPTIFDAKGDLLVATAADTPARLAVGSNDQVLTVDSSTATGLKWAAASGSSGPAFFAYRGTSNQTVAQNTTTKVQFNAEKFDTDNCFDSTTNYRFTPTKAGYYEVQLSLWAGNGSNGTEAYSYIYKNGSEYQWTDFNPNTVSPILQGNTLVYMNGSTDYLEGYVYLNASSGTRQVYNYESASNFSAVWIRS